MTLNLDTFVRPLSSFMVLLVVVLLKNADLVWYAAPYFEDGAYLFPEPRWSAAFSVFQFMGGGYVHFVPRAVALVVASAPMDYAAPIFVLFSLTLKAVCACAIYAFLRRVLSLSDPCAFLIALGSLFVQSANFTLDTLLISSIWNLTAISIFLVLTLHRLSVWALILAAIFVTLSIVSTVASAATGLALVCVLTVGMNALGGIDVIDDGPLRARIWICCGLLGVVAFYFLFGVGYRELALEERAAAGYGIAQPVQVFARTIFERSIVEALFGRAAREWVAGSSFRDTINLLGAAAANAAFVSWIIVEWRENSERRALALTVFAVVNALTLMLVVSGRYNDGYGAAQHYYIQSILFITVVGYALARTSPALLVTCAALYLANAGWQLPTTRMVAIVGDPRINHAIFSEMIAKFQSNTCVRPCVLSGPAIWSPPWSIRFGP